MSSAAYADSGSISFRVLKAGFVIGGSGGSGTLTFHGRSYPISIGGISYGFTFGASETRFHGTVSNIRSPSDVAGVYAAGNVGAAVGRGAQAIVLTNQKGAVLSLTGRSAGAIVSADLNGLAITVRGSGALVVWPFPAISLLEQARRDARQGRHDEIPLTRIASRSDLSPHCGERESEQASRSRLSPIQFSNSLFSVIPGRERSERARNRYSAALGLWIPGSRFARPGMTRRRAPAPVFFAAPGTPAFAPSQLRLLPNLARSAASPLFFNGAGTPPSFPSPRKRGPGVAPDKTRGWSTERRTSLPSCRAPRARNAGASRRSIAAFLSPGP